MIKFLQRLWVFVRPYRGRLILGLVCGICFAISNVVLAGVLRIAVNFVFPKEVDASMDRKLAHTPAFVRSAVEYLTAQLQHFLQTSSSKTTIVLIICLIPAVMLVRAVFAYLNTYLMNWASVRAIADLRVRLFNHLQNLQLGFFHQASTGELISRVTSDTQQLQSIIGNSFASIFRDPIMIAFMLAYLIFQAPVLTLVSVVVLPACIVPITIYSRKVRRSGKAMQAHAAEMAKVMHESFTGNRVIKAYNLEEAVVEQFRQATRKYIGHIMRVVRSNEIPGNVMEFLGSVGAALVLIYVVFHGSANPGDFFAFIAGIFLMYQPIKSLAKMHNQLHQAQSASHRVFELLDTESTIREPASPVLLEAAGKDIRFENVNFDYGEKPVLRGIDLTVKAGKLVALVGSSGSGKTTLVNLLPRFYDPQSGVVRIGQTDIRQVSIKDLRRQVAVVTQETILFHDTIRHNIALGNPGATDAEIEAAARHANAHDFIMQKPNGYDSVVGEKGVALSGGQRQRIAIARAIVKNAPILVLDEATSALDTESERAVQTALEALMEGRTTICIAHRLSTIQNADLIVVLKEGRIVETGTHAELVQGGSTYQRLYELQFHNGSARVAPQLSIEAAVQE